MAGIGDILGSIGNFLSSGIGAITRPIFGGMNPTTGQYQSGPYSNWSLGGVDWGKTLSGALPIGMSLLSMMGNKQPTVKWSQPPRDPLTEQARQQAMQMSTQGWSGPETMKQIYNQIANLNVSRGLAPTWQSGAFNQSMADAIARQSQAEYGSKLNATQVAMGGVQPAQMTVQQATPNPLVTGLSTYLDLVNKANMANALGKRLGDSPFSFSLNPWANL